MIDILVVEDNKEIATLLKDFLSKENYIVTQESLGTLTVNFTVLEFWHT